ncbi:MAG TPA: glycosyltransferase family 2 protein [Saprospiraceae bacterium]|nr:glycosyltransferase family 2 protein [Saprospiraceae bacterium]
MNKKPSLSFVIPVYNEGENIKDLYHEIVDMCLQSQFTDFEVIVVDDNSTDHTLDVLRALTPIKVITFRKQFGQTAAMDAGIKAAVKDLIVTMDGDGQNDPAEVPKMVEYLFEKDLDVVSGWRKHRKDTTSKKTVSRVANFLRSKIINDGINDSGCSLKVYRKECFDYVNLYGEMHRFIPAILKIQGFKVGEVVVNHRARTKGLTKYTWSRSVKGLIDMIAVWFWKKYALRPLHLLGALGFGFIFLSFLFGIMTVREYLTGQDLSDTLWLMLTLFTFMIGLVIFISGLIMDILVKSYFETTTNRPYLIKEIFENK